MKTKIVIAIILVEIISGIVTGVTAAHLYARFLPLILKFVVVYSVATIGIALPGYFHLISIGNHKLYFRSILSSIIGTLFGAFLLFLSLFFLPGHITESFIGLIIIYVPILFGVAGFNYLVYKKKKNLPITAGT